MTWHMHIYFPLPAYSLLLMATYRRMASLGLPGCTCKWYITFVCATDE